MPRRAQYSASLVARVRLWFGLQQDEVALLLGVSPSMVRHFEAHRRALSAEVLATLRPLVQQLPPEAERLSSRAPIPAADPAPVPLAPPPALAPGTPLPKAATLDLRRRACLLAAARLRDQAAAVAQQATVAARWAAALPTLLATLPALASSASADTAAPSAAFDCTAWLREWLTQRAQPLPVEAATRYHLLLARATAHEAEAAMLAVSDLAVARSR